MPEGKFYIGWEQPDISGNKIPIGYDVNSPTGIDFLYYSVGQGWQSARKRGLRAGSLMMRPVLGSEAVIPTAVKYKQWDELKIFPNPSSDWIQIDGDWENANGKIELFDMSGVRILAKPLQSTIDVQNIAAGIYLIKVTNLKEQKIASRLIEILH